MKYIIKYILGLSLLLTMTFSTNWVQAQTTNFAEMKPAALVNVWMTRHCGVEDELRLKKALLAKPAEINRLLLDAFKQGPAEKDLAEISKVSQQQFQNMVKALESGNDFGLSKEDLEVARSQTEAGFIENATANFQYAWKSKALAGLALLGGQEGEDVILELAKNEKSPLQGQAQRILKRKEKQE